MRILVTGRGSSGSWKIRGEQLGREIGATVDPRATDVQGYDLAIIVKRYTTDLIARLRWSKVRIVWDVVDAWPQPQGNFWSEAESKDWLQRQVELMKPVGIVAATRAMGAFCEPLGKPVLSLPHHARPGDAVNPIRERVRTVGYQGAPHYLGKWHRALETECAARGWSFVMNPAELADVDICVALREQTGYTARNWKSNCKLANAQGSGTPIVLSPESGYAETMSGAEEFVDTPDELAAALDRLTPHEARKQASTMMLQAAPKLDQIAVTYNRWLSQWKFS